MPFPLKTKPLECAINYDKRKITQDFIRYCKKRFSKKTWVLHPSTSVYKKSLGDYIFNRKISMVENLASFCKKGLNLTNVQKENGILLKNLEKDKKRIIIHPSGNKERYHWPLKKYISLAKKLQKVTKKSCIPLINLIRYWN